MPFGGHRVRLAAVLLTGAGLLTGCANRDPAAAPATSSPAAAVQTPLTRTTAAAPSPATGTTTVPHLPGMPVPTATRDSGVDSTRINSLADLPAAFQCPNTVTPITIPGSTPTGTSTAKPTPDAIVCSSQLAKDEALYLWFYATAEDKLAALTAALSVTRYVHAGPNWVAGGTINPDMGTVGGQVYR